MANDIHHLPFNRVDSVDVTDPRENNSFLDINELNRINDKNDVNERFDHTFFSKIDPDLNIADTNECLYYNEQSFNDKHYNSNTLSFIHINICSIPKNYSNFDIFLNNLRHSFPIICCSESWFKESTKDRYTPTGCTHVYDYRPKKRGGGTSIFIRDSIQYEERMDLRMDLHQKLNKTHSQYLF